MIQIETRVFFNLHGSVVKMVVTGEKNITKHNLHYIKFYGDGDQAKEKLPVNI